MTITLESLISEDSIHFNNIEQISFEDVMLDVSDIMIESSELDSEIHVFNMAMECSVNLEDNSTFIQKMKNLILKIIAFIQKLIVGISVIIQAPVRFLIQLIKHRDVKAAARDIKMLLLNFGDVVDINVLNMPTEEKQKRITKLMQRTYAEIQNSIDEGVKLADYLKDIFNKANQSFGSFDNAKRFYDNYDKHNQSPDEPYKPEDDFTEKQADIQKEIEDILKMNNCKSVDDLEKSIDMLEEIPRNAAANKASLAEVSNMINIIQKLIQTNGGKFNQLEAKIKTKVFKFLDQAKARLITLQTLSKYDAKLTKDMFEAINKLESEFKKKK